MDCEAITVGYFKDRSKASRWWVCRVFLFSAVPKRLEQLPVDESRAHPWKMGWEDMSEAAWGWQRACGSLLSWSGVPRHWKLGAMSHHWKSTKAWWQRQWGSVAGSWEAEWGSPGAAQEGSSLDISPNLSQGACLCSQGQGAHHLTGEWSCNVSWKNFWGGGTWRWWRDRHGLEKGQRGHLIPQCLLTGHHA